jgi:nucleoside-diphosphate-sugar epimerase
MIVARVATATFARIAPMVVGDRFNSVSSGSLDFLARDNPFSSERARRELGWDPPVHPEQGIVESFRWWAQHH